MLSGLTGRIAREARRSAAAYPSGDRAQLVQAGAGDAVEDGQRQEDRQADERCDQKAQDTGCGV
jgi:hypothetical protein